MCNFNRYTVIQYSGTTAETSLSLLLGFKVTRQSLWRSSLSWKAVSTNKRPSAPHFMSNQQCLGIQLAQLSRDASAATVFAIDLHS
ncbi:hypothetical protein GBA52_016078 [Prunus armeniaca]|nr:hypothetical protein GBA52_016078 [Prunus armeniaca]